MRLARTLILLLTLSLAAAACQDTVTTEGTNPADDADPVAKSPGSVTDLPKLINGPARRVQDPAATTSTTTAKRVSPSTTAPASDAPPTTGSDDGSGPDGSAPPTTETSPPAPTTPPPPAPDHSLSLVYSGSRNGPAIGVLDDAEVDSPFEARVEVAGTAPTQVVWQIDGRTFRNDDVEAPFNIRYTGVLPLGQPFASDQAGQPGTWVFETGGAYTIAARASFSDGTETVVEAQFQVTGSTDSPTSPAPAPPPSTTSPPPPASSPPPTPPGGGTGDATLFVALGGSGDCSQASPCGSFHAAVTRASSGDVVQVAAGSYPSQEIPLVAATQGWASNVRFEPAPGASVTVRGIYSATPRLTFRGFNVTGDLYMRPGAHHNRAEYNSISTAFVTGADATVWVGNQITPSRPGPDAMQIKGLKGDNPIGVTVEGNVIGPAWREGDSHTDCIQILGGTNVVIRNNKMLPCSDKALQIWSGAGGTVGTVWVENNFLMECKPRREGCDGWHAITVHSAEANNLTLVHNTIYGSVAIGPNDGSYAGLTQYGNIADQLPCTPNTDWNMVRDGGTCGPNDFVAVAEFVDSAQLVGNLHLAPRSPGVSAGSPHAPARDIDGETACQPSNIGADQFC